MVTLDRIREHLRSNSLRYYTDAERQTLIVPFSKSTIFIQLIENGEGLQFRVPNVFDLDEATEHDEVCLLQMARHVYATRIGHFGVDPRDNAIDVNYFLPVEDGDVTATQVMRIIRALLSVAEGEAPQLRKIGQTGDTDPGIFVPSARRKAAEQDAAEEEAPPRAADAGPAQPDLDDDRYEYLRDFLDSVVDSAIDSGLDDESGEVEDEA